MGNAAAPIEKRNITMLYFYKGLVNKKRPNLLVQPFLHQ